MAPAPGVGSEIDQVGSPWRAGGSSGGLGGSTCHPCFSLCQAWGWRSHCWGDWESAGRRSRERGGVCGLQGIPSFQSLSIRPPLCPSSASLGQFSGAQGSTVMAGASCWALGCRAQEQLHPGFPTSAPSRRNLPSQIPFGSKNPRRGSVCPKAVEKS